jgi:hypothetical protein
MVDGRRVTRGASATEDVPKTSAMARASLVFLHYAGARKYVDAK